MAGQHEAHGHPYVLRRTHSAAGRRGRLRAVRGFSMLELGVSLSMFLLLAAGLAVAVVSALGASAEARESREATDRLTQQLEKVAVIDYASLLGNTFTSPDLCGDSGSGEGVSGSACLPAGQRQIRVAYSYARRTSEGLSICGSETPPTSARADGYVELCAATETEGGRAVEVSRKINAPVAGYAAGQGSVRVTLTGDVSALPGPVYLVPVATPAAPAASGTADGSGVVLLSAPANACTTASPCMLALNPGNAPAQVRGVALTSSTALGSGATIALTTGQLTETSAVVTRTGSAKVELWAANDGGGNAARNPVRGSVCLWVSFVDQGQQRTAPVCNTADAATVDISDYNPTLGLPGDAGLRFPFPVGVPLKLSVDSPDGACRYAPGMIGSTPGTAATADVPAGWSQAAVCTSWTWGVPATLAAGTDAPKAFADATVTLSPQAADRYKLTWSGDGARPAAGHNDDPTWARPRQAVGCAFDATCRSAATAPPPESTECPGQYCFSAANIAPTLTAPASGGVNLDSSGTLTTTFTLTVADRDGHPVSAKVTKLPVDGVVRVGGVPATVGTALLSAKPSPASVAVSYEQKPGTTELRVLSVELSDGKPGGTRTVDVALYHTVAPWTLTGDDVSATQGQSQVPVSVTVLGTDGKALANTPVTFTADAGITFAPATVSTDASGVARTAAAFPTAKAGVRTITATASGRSVTMNATVAAAAGQLTMTSSGAAQGGAGTIDVAATDLAGDPVGGVTVNLVALGADGNPAQLVYPQHSGCVTSAAGTCRVALTVESAAPAGTYTVRATSGGFTRTAQVAITALARTLTAPEDATLTQGGTAELTLTLRDGAGAALGSTDVTFTSGGPITLTPATVRTAADGTVTVTATAAATVPAGKAAFTATAAGVSVRGTVRITSTPTALSASALTLAQGAAAPLSVVLTDGAGKPAPGVRVTFTPAVAGVTISGAPTTDQSGRASVTVTVASGVAAGAVKVAVAAGPVRSEATVTVTPTASGAALSGAAVQGGTSTLTVRVADGAGSPMPGVTVALADLPTGLTAAAAAGVTDATGATTVAVTDTATLHAGTYPVTVTANGRTLPAALTVLPTPASLTPDTETLTVPAGGSGQLKVTVADQAGDAIAGATVAVSAPEGLAVTVAGETDGSGQVQLSVDATPALAPGSYPVTLRAGLLTRVVTFTVT